MSNSARKRRSYRATVRYGHKSARQATKAVLRGDSRPEPVRGLGYWTVLPQPPLQEVPVETKGGIEPSPDQNKQKVASNRCGNECNRRAQMGDYLCSRCRV